MTNTDPVEAPAVREWISLVDANSETWLFDLSFFASNWNCIYGSGCAGIEETPNVEAQRGCCSYGAHFADDEDLTRVMEIASALPAELWENSTLRPPTTASRAENFDSMVGALTALDEDGDRTTIVVDGACVFHNSPEHPTGAGCAFHYAAVASEVEPLEWKPEVCWQLPIRVEHHLDDNDQSTHMVRQWTRADWGEAGLDLGWWCSEASEAFTGTTNVARYLSAEVTALAGQDVANALISYIDDRNAGVRGAIPVAMPTRKSSEM